MTQAHGTLHLYLYKCAIPLRYQVGKYNNSPPHLMHLAHLNQIFLLYINLNKFSYHHEQVLFINELAIWHIIVICICLFTGM